jgi:hypothetical protein
MAFPRNQQGAHPRSGPSNVKALASERGVCLALAVRKVTDVIEQTRQVFLGTFPSAETIGVFAPDAAFQPEFCLSGIG